MEKPFTRVPAEVPVSQLTPLDVKCKSTKCEDGLHCFKASKKSVQKWGESGVCFECGTKLINWERVHKNDISDAKFIVSSLKNELVRHVFWHTKIEKRAIDRAVKTGKNELRIRAQKILQTRIGKAENFREGYQTPKTGDEIVYYAQHATATCCRKCLEYWHNIQIGRELSKQELKFCTDLVMLYVNEKIPNLTEEVIGEQHNQGRGNGVH